MARISGVNIPSGKRIEIALTYVYGIGSTRAKKICKEAALEPNKRVNNLTEEELTRIRDIGCYRGLRHRKGLPVRGQRTNTNARTRKGKSAPVAGKKKA